jgi:hypothetical protein
VFHYFKKVIKIYKNFDLKNLETILNVEEIALSDQQKLLDLPVVKSGVGTT